MDKMIDACKRGIIEHKPVVIGSGHAQSKDFLISGRLSLWFLEAYGPCIVLMTGPTDRQVQNVMWSEMLRALGTRNHPDDGLPQPLKTIFKLREDWYILPFTTKDTKDAIGKFQGFHSDRMMVIISEAQAIPDEVFDQIEGCTTGSVALHVYLGNPLRTSGRFASMLQDNQKNIVVNLSALESPNYIEKKAIIPGMATYEWIEDKRKRWGEADPRWFARVLGQVPPTGVNSIFSYHIYKISQSRQISSSDDKTIIAIDVATSGQDDCQMYAVSSSKILGEKTISGSTDLRIIAQEAMILRKDFKSSSYIYDGNGVGDGLGDILRLLEADPSIRIIKSKGSERASDDKQFQNQRAEDSFYARQRLVDGLFTMPQDDDGGPNDMLKDELLALEYFVNPRGRVQIIDKDEIKDKIGHSPNRADAFILAMKGLKMIEAKPKRPSLEKFRNRQLETVSIGSEYGDWHKEDQWL